MHGTSSFTWVICMVACILAVFAGQSVNRSKYMAHYVVSEEEVLSTISGLRNFKRKITTTTEGSGGKAK